MLEMYSTRRLACCLTNKSLKKGLTNLGSYWQINIGLGQGFYLTMFELSGSNTNTSLVCVAMVSELGREVLDSNGCTEAQDLSGYRALRSKFHAADAREYRIRAWGSNTRGGASRHLHPGAGLSFVLWGLYIHFIISYHMFPFVQYLAVSGFVSRLP